MHFQDRIVLGASVKQGCAERCPLCHISICHTWTAPPGISRKAMPKDHSCTRANQCPCYTVAMYLGAALLAYVPLLTCDVATGCGLNSPRQSRPRK